MSGGHSALDDLPETGPGEVPEAADSADKTSETVEDGASGHETLGDEVRATLNAAQALLSAELAYARALVARVGKYAGMALALTALALALVFFLLMALVVGLLLALAPVLGPWGALAAVAGGLLVAIGLCGLGAWAWVRRLIRLFGGGKSA